MPTEATTRKDWLIVQILLWAFTNRNIRPHHNHKISHKSKFTQSRYIYIQNWISSNNQQQLKVYGKIFNQVRIVYIELCSYYIRIHAINVEDLGAIKVQCAFANEDMYLFLCNDVRVYMSLANGPVFINLCKFISSIWYDQTPMYVCANYSRIVILQNNMDWLKIYYSWIFAWIL